MKRSKKRIENNCRYQHEQEKQILMSRRKFLGSSGISLASMSTVSPILAGLFKSEQAYAATASDVSIYTFQAAGGWAGRNTGIAKLTEATNNGDLVPSSIWQSRYGVPSNIASVTDGIFTGFGAVGATPGPAWFYKNGTGGHANFFLKGILTEVNKDANAATIIRNFLPGTISTNTGNDNTPGVPGDFASIVSLLMQAASKKPLSAHVIGTVNTNSGNGTGGAGFISSTMARINAEGPVSNLLAMGAFCQTLSATEPQFQAIASRIEHFVGVRLSSLGSSSFAERFAAIHRSALSELKTRVAPLAELSASALNPCNDATAKLILNIPPATTPAQFAASTSGDDRIKTMLWAIANGVGAVASAQFGGMDYHGMMGGANGVSMNNNDPANTPDGRDERLGKVVGMAMRLNHYLGRPAMFVITSDGSVRATGNHSLGPDDQAALWEGDDNRYCQWLMAYFKAGPTASGIGEVHQLRWHAGKNSAATGSHIEGSAPETNPRFAALIVAANIAYAMGLQNHFSTVALTAGYNQNDVNAAMAKRFFG